MGSIILENDTCILSVYAAPVSSQCLPSFFIFTTPSLTCVNNGDSSVNMNTLVHPNPLTSPTKAGTKLTSEGYVRKKDE